MPEDKNLTNSKNKLLVVALVLVLPLFLTACTLADLPYVGRFFGDQQTDQGPIVVTGPVNLTIWGLWENPDVVAVLIDKFNEQSPDASINYDDRSVIKPLVDYKERAFTRASDETGPDVMRVHVSWVPRLANSLAPMPEEMMSVEAYRSAFYPAAADNLVVNGRIYGLPSYYDGLVLVYNKSHFAEIGQTEPPTAWEEFRRLALELTVRGEGNRIERGGAAIGSADNIDFFSDILGLLFSQALVNIPNNIEGKPAQDALSFYTNFVLEDEVWSNDLPEASVAFAQERVSMIFVPTWNLLDIIAARPDLDIGVASVPQALPDSPSSWANFWVDVVPIASKNTDAAWSYVFFMAQEEQQLLAYSEASKYRAYGAPYSLTSLAPELETNPFINPVLQTASHAKTAEIASRAGNRRQVDALREAVNSLLVSGGAATPEEVLTKVKAELLR